MEEKLIQVAKDPEGRKVMAVKAREVALERFGVERMLDDYVAAYRAILADWPPSRPN